MPGVMRKAPHAQPGIDMAAIVKLATVPQTPFRRKIGNVIHAPIGLAPTVLIEIAGIAGIVERAADVMPGCKAMNARRRITFGDEIGNKAFEF